MVNEIFIHDVCCNNVSNIRVIYIYILGRAIVPFIVTNTNNTTKNLSNKLIFQINYN